MNHGLALDRASVRSYDRDGRLHVTESPISKATVSSYYGREIPNWQGLRLDPNRIYKLLRAPDELEKGVATFNNLPLLKKHIPVTAAKPSTELIVGTTGSDSMFDGTYLKNSLAIWDAESIAGIESDEQKELSAAYHYVADMTPGMYDGIHHDGVMRDIVGNHVALVEEGRVGADVVVCDSLPLELKHMKLNKKMVAVAVRAALGAYLQPKLAQDAAPKEIASLLKAGGSAKSIAEAAKNKFGTLLAQDMEIDSAELASIIEAVADDAETQEPAELPAQDDDICAQVLELLAGKLPEEDLAKIRALISGTPAQDDDPDNKPEPKEEDSVSKPAMDAAIRAATRKAEKDTVNRINAIRIAEAEVKPLIGDVVAMDSADEIYKVALDEVGVDTTGVHPSAYRSLVKMQIGIAESAKLKAHLAMDSAAIDSFEKRFPTASKLVRI
ncbi:MULTISPECIES: DUF2213 domain-containing protein [Photorhabdus]|uniref:Photorhabdus luminescens subsp. laumondii TTO1 complete genome segment 12/17 n=1 Tax=Photorhabdus laumondii subsp. laumondii (strain DSM 15139 / CIP 105565 / TT01) TaxID=243265 RepID=Q7N1R6_PHOLL|nr:MULTISPECIES: DUF2213 domain-containing protein [Photorhabdus]AWK43073.1 hypothetical protein A4R40_16970 [Photorhabdus laumondii subsp. laumondii]AXG48386.1 DUF2213 domain-containing protein [Photorhabdus laumondii subsp. laumondii]NHB63331.1 DUF2213 domain-containing protein [Photorhabdus sp. RW14-46]CAE15777.1 unnamed protein product [Photorhabdus laumondii subsp. laumondii TTO1]